MKNIFTIIFAIITAILIFIPVSPVILKILYYAEFAFGFIILEIVCVGINSLLAAIKSRTKSFSNL